MLPCFVNTFLKNFGCTAAAAAFIGQHTAHVADGDDRQAAEQHGYHPQKARKHSRWRSYRFPTNNPQTPSPQLCRTHANYAKQPGVKAKPARATIIAKPISVRSTGVKMPPRFVGENIAKSICVQEKGVAILAQRGAPCVPRTMIRINYAKQKAVHA